MKKLVSAVIIVIMVITLMSPAMAAGNSQKKKPDTGVTLDGYFDDWVGKPEAQFQYNWKNDGQFATVKWYSDNEYLYLYIRMGNVGYTYFSTNVIFYHVNGSDGIIQVQPDDPAIGRVSVYNYSMDYRPFSNDGYIVRGPSNGINGDQVEFRIPLSMFIKKSNDNADIKMEFPDLGDQFIHFHTGSTGPYVGIALCILASFAGVFIYKRKKTI